MTDDLKAHMDLWGLEDTDFESHHIEGIAREGMRRPDGGFFSVPLVTHVQDNLWQGGCKQGVRLPDQFHHVISLYPWEQYKLGPDTGRDEITMYDAGSLPDLAQLHEIAELVNEKKAEGPTLVHCQAGLNRSGLVAALSLILEDEDRTPEEAINLLRSTRCEMVLCNKTFEKYLLEYDRSEPYGLLPPA